MKQAYLLLAIVGAIVPYVFFVDFIAANGLALGGFVSALFVNGAAGGFAADLVISSAVFWLFMVSKDGPNPWGFVALNLVIGLSCALPAYLYALERAADRNAVAGDA